jgi:hypothetical protein
VQPERSSSLAYFALIAWAEECANASTNTLVSSLVFISSNLLLHKQTEYDFDILRLLDAVRNCEVTNFARGQKALYSQFGEKLFRSKTTLTYPISSDCSTL